VIVQSTAVVTWSTTFIVYRTITETVAETITVSTTQQTTSTEVDSTTSVVTDISNVSVSPTSTVTDTTTTTSTSSLQETVYDSSIIISSDTVTTTVPTTISTTTTTLTQLATVTLPTRYRLFCAVPGQGVIDLHLTIDFAETCMNFADGFVEQGYGYLVTGITGTAVYPYSIDPSGPGLPTYPSYPVEILSPGAFVWNDNCYFLSRWNYIQYVDTSGGIGFYADNMRWIITLGGADYHYLLVDNQLQVAGGGLCASAPENAAVKTVFIMTCNGDWGILNMRLTTSNTSCGNTGGMLISAFAGVRRTPGGSYTVAPDNVYSTMNAVNTYNNNDNCLYPSGGAILDTYGLSWRVSSINYRLRYDGTQYVLTRDYDPTIYNGACGLTTVG
jgi:hypothetical protein